MKWNSANEKELSFISRLFASNNYELDLHLKLSFVVRSDAYSSYSFFSSSSYRDDFLVIKSKKWRCFYSVMFIRWAKITSIVFLINDYTCEFWYWVKLLLMKCSLFWILNIDVVDQEILYNEKFLYKINNNR